MLPRVLPSPINAMRNIQLSAIYRYPLKSARGEALDTAVMDQFGLAGDRRWMLVQANGQFQSQRRLPAMESWTKFYDENAYALRDPLVFWGLGVKGSTRWSAIKLPDPFNILGQAKCYGLAYGAVISCGPITSRSIVGMAHNEREFTDEEISEAVKIVHNLHYAAEPPTELTPAQVEALRLLADGDRHAAAAAKLGISESAFKARLQSARVRLGARTTAQALKKAREYQLL